MSVLATIGSSTHEVPTKTMKRFGIAGLGEDVGDVVARANVVERQGIVNHRMMINKGVRDSKMAKATKIPATTRDGADWTRRLPDGARCPLLCRSSARPCGEGGRCGLGAPRSVR